MPLPRRPTTSVGRPVCDHCGRPVSPHANARLPCIGCTRAGHRGGWDDCGPCQRVVRAAMAEKSRAGEWGP
jgi:hypothetical protein